MAQYFTSRIDTSRLRQANTSLKLIATKSATRICEVHCVSEVRRWQVKLSGTVKFAYASEDEEKNSFVALYNFLSACYNLSRKRNHKICRNGGIGRRKGLKIPRWKHRIGSTPIFGTKTLSRNHAESVFCFRITCRLFVFNLSLLIKQVKNVSYIKCRLLVIIHFVLIFGFLSANLLPKPFSYDKIIQY